MLKTKSFVISEASIRDQIVTVREHKKGRGEGEGGLIHIKHFSLFIYFNAEVNFAHFKFGGVDDARATMRYG